MARALTSFILILLVALGAVWVADHPGRVTADWLGFHVELPVALMLGLVIAVTVLTYGLARFLVWTLSSFTAIGGFFRGWRERRARKALTRGLLALATGDADTARRVIGQAGRVKGEQPLLLLLRAQTAEHSGGEGDAEQTYRAMLDHPETELLGLLGLVRLLRARGETGAALEYAERAVRLQPSNAQAFEAAFALHMGMGEWAEARRTVEGALRARLLLKPAGRRRLAAVHLAEALDTRKEEADLSALQSAQKALSLAPDLVPAAVFVAGVLRRLGRRGKAGSVIEAAWARAPHPDLGRIYAQLQPRESAEERFQRISGLTAGNREHLEARVLFARYAIAAGRFREARETLEPLAEPQPTARVAELMAKIEELENRDAKAAEGWLARAAHAPRDALWLCKTCGRQAAHWSPVCPQCEGFDTQYWKASGEPALLAEEAEDPDAPHGAFAAPGHALIEDGSAPAPANDGPFMLPRQPDDPGPETPPRARAGR